MKTFVEFILICEKLNKTHDENSQSKLWNYFIANPDDRKIRDLILNNDLKKAEEEIKKQVSAAKTNPEHPLNFANAGDEEFSKKEGRQPNDEQDYNNFLDDSVSGLLALGKQKKLRSAIEKGFPSRVTGSGASELSKKFKEAGGTDKTPKGDLEIYNPDDPKDRRGISMKKGAGAQLASAEGGELKGMYKIAAKEFIKKFHSNKSKEERGRIEKEIMSDAERLSAIGRLQKTAGEASDVDKQKQNLKNVSQGISDRLLDKYPQFERLLSQVATSGKGKFKGNDGTAGIVLTGKNKGKEASAKPAEQQKSSKPRLALPKGTSRPGNLKIDYRPEEPVSRQSTFSDFSKQAIDTQQKFADAEAQSQKALSKAEKNLEVANIKAQNASVPIDPDTGEPIPARFRATAIQNMAADPTSRTAKINNARREKSQSIITKAQSEYDNAAASHQETQSTLDAIQQNKQPQQQTPPSEQQPQQSAATTTPSEPTQPQQQTQPPQQTPAQERQPQQQAEPSGPKTAAQQAAELGLTGDGHGRWYDNKGNVAAETEGDILKRTAQLKPKPKNTGTAERMDAAGKKLGLPDS